MSTDTGARGPWGTVPRATRAEPTRQAIDGHPVERFLQSLLVAVAVAVFGGALYALLRADAGPDGLGTRIFVAVVALVILAGLDSQYGRLVSRRARLSLSEAPEERRYRIRSALLAIGAALVLGTITLWPNVARTALQGTATWYAAPAVLSALAAAVVRFGLPRARKYRQPERWRGGVIATASGLMLLWLLPLGAMAVVAKGLVPRELGIVLGIAALVVAVGVLGAGMDALAKANNTPKDDSWDIF